MTETLYLHGIHSIEQANAQSLIPQKGDKHPFHEWVITGITSRPLSDGLVVEVEYSKIDKKAVFNPRMQNAKYK